MKKIGLTGGIGSGKSLVGEVLEKMGYPVYYSDAASKLLVDTDNQIKSELIELVGAEVYQDGELNRPFLANRIFKDDALRLKVNEIIHPKVRAHFSNWCSMQASELVFNEAAILVETGAYKSMDATVLVTAPETIKLKRVMSRDRSSEQEVKERMNKQWPDEMKMPLVNYILVNDEVEPLLSQIEQLLQDLI